MVFMEVNIPVPWILWGPAFSGGDATRFFPAFWWVLVVVCFLYGKTLREKFIEKITGIINPNKVLHKNPSLNEL